MFGNKQFGNTFANRNGSSFGQQQQSNRGFGSQISSGGTSFTTRPLQRSGGITSSNSPQRGANFGKSTWTTGGFGRSNQGLGSPRPSGNLFGAKAAGGSGVFGNRSPAAVSNTFGTKTSGPSFSAHKQVGGTGVGMGNFTTGTGTRAQFQSVAINDGGKAQHFAQSICMQPAFQKQSMEELRINDLMNGGNQGSQASGLGSSAFGQQSSLYPKTNTSPFKAQSGLSTSNSQSSFGFGANASRSGLGNFSANKPTGFGGISERLGFGGGQNTSAIATGGVGVGSSGLNLGSKTRFGGLGASSSGGTGFGATDAGFRTGSGFGANTGRPFGGGGFGVNKNSTFAGSTGFGSDGLGSKGGGFGGFGSQTSGLKAPTTGFGASSAGFGSNRTGIGKNSSGFGNAFGSPNSKTGTSGFGSSKGFVTGGFSGGGFAFDQTNAGFGGPQQIAPTYPTTPLDVSCEEDTKSKFDCLSEKRKELENEIILSDYKVETSLSQQGEAFSLRPYRQVSRTGTHIGRKSKMRSNTSNIQIPTLSTTSLNQELSTDHSSKRLVINLQPREEIVDFFLLVGANEQADVHEEVKECKQDGYARAQLTSSPSAASRTLVRGDPERSRMPKLTRKNYYTKPSLSELEQMTPEDLSLVNEFTIGCEGAGEVTWEGITDVTNLDLDKIIRFVPEETAVHVYEEHDYTDPTRKPPVGQELNKPAIITLYGVQRKVKSNEDPIQANLKYRVRLENSCRSNGDEHIDYDVSTGTWRFRAFHFSRKGLVDDDDSDDESQPPVNRPMHAQTSAAKTAPTSSQAVALVEQSKVARNRIVIPSPALSQGIDMNLEESPDMLRSDIDDVYDEPLWSIPAPVPSPFDTRLLSSLIPYVGLRVTRTPYSVHKHTHQSVQETDWDESKDVPIRNRTRRDTSGLETDHFVGVSKMQPRINATSQRTTHTQTKVPAPFAFQTASASYCHQLMIDRLEQLSGAPASRRMTNLGLGVCSGMSRSFRVGWAPDGRFVHCGTVSKVTSAVAREPKHTPNLSYVRTHGMNHQLVIQKLSAGFSARHYDHLMAAHMRQSQSEPRAPLASRSMTSQWRFPRVVRQNLDEEGYFRFVTCLHDLMTCMRGGDGSRPASDSDWCIGRSVALLNALVGQEDKWLQHRRGALVEGAGLGKKTSTMAFVASDTAAHIQDRRMEMINDWLEETVHVVARPVPHNWTWPKRVLGLLCLHDTTAAARECVTNGASRLALLVAQAGHAQSQLCADKQLMAWDAEAIKFIDPAIVCVYQVLAGWVSKDEEDEVFFGIEDCMQGLQLHWMQHLGLCIWYNRHVAESRNNLKNLRDDVGAHGHNMEANSYTSWTDWLRRDPLGGSHSVLFRILELVPLMCNDSLQELPEYLLRKLMNALAPEGFTDDVVDYRGSWLLMCLLDSLGLLGPSLEEACSIVTRHYISQLIADHQWRWAVYVALHIKDHIVRDNLVETLVTYMCAPAYTHEQTFEKDVDWTVDTLLVLDAVRQKARGWSLYSAHTAHLPSTVDCRNAMLLACRACTQAQAWDEAQAAISYILPYCMLTKDDEPTRQMLFALVDAKQRSELGAANDNGDYLLFYNFYRLRDSLIHDGGETSMLQTVRATAQLIDQAVNIALSNPRFADCVKQQYRVLALQQMATDLAQEGERLALRVGADPFLGVVLGSVLWDNRATARHRRSHRDLIFT